MWIKIPNYFSFTGNYIFIANPSNGFTVKFSNQMGPSIGWSHNLQPLLSLCQQIINTNLFATNVYNTVWIRLSIRIQTKNIGGTVKTDVNDAANYKTWNMTSRWCSCSYCIKVSRNITNKYHINVCICVSMLTC